MGRGKKSKKKKVTFNEKNRSYNQAHGRREDYYSKKDKRNNKRKGFVEEVEVRESKKSLEQQYLEDYARAVTSRAKRPFTLKYFGRGYDESRLKEYEYEIKKTRFLSNPKNRQKLIDICNQHLRNVFGPDGPDNYSIPGKYRLSDVPTDKPGREPEEYVFTHDDTIWNAFMKAKKIPIGDWEQRQNTSTSKIKTKKFLLNVDTQILVGELTIETTKAYDSIEKGAKSGIKFCIYYRGKEDGKFIVDRWDYEPLSQHLNKFDHEGYFQVDGVHAPHTGHSHEHRYTLHNRLVLTQNQSPDICPTPINAGVAKGEPEKKYGSFGAMVTAFEEEFNFTAIPIPEKELRTETLRKLGRKYCPEYNTELNEEFPAMVDVSAASGLRLAKNTKILGNGQITIDIDAYLKPLPDYTEGVIIDNVGQVTDEAEEREEEQDNKPAQEQDGGLSQ